MVYLDGWDLGTSWEGAPQESASSTSPVVQPPQVLGQLPLLCSENMPRTSSHTPCSKVFSTLGTLRVDLALSYSICAHSEMGTLSVQQLYVQMLVPHITRRPWPESLWRSYHRHCGKLKKSLSLLTTDHPSLFLRASPSPFWTNSCLLVGGENPLPFLPDAAVVDMGHTT